MAGKLAKLLAELKEREALEYVQKTLSQNADPGGLLAEAREGLTAVGQKYSRSEYFIPDLIFSGEIMKGVVKLLEPHLKQGRQESRAGKVVIGTVAGDIHDIGKSLVVFMLEANGYEVTDLGIDVPAEKFVEAVRQTNSRVVGLSGFLTLAFDAMKHTVQAIKSAGLTGVKTMVGGGQIDEQVRSFTGAEAYGKDAMEAVRLAKNWIGG